MSKYKLILLPLFLVSLLFSCRSTAPMVGEDWNEEMFFKSAQESFDEDRLDNALFYYDVYLLRYPTNKQKAIAAEYEKAYILYKWEEYDRAERYFNILLERYETDPYAYMYPKAYQVLALKVLENIQAKREIQELPFFKRKAALREFYGNSRDESEEPEVVRP